MLCKLCQIKVARNCVQSMGGATPCNALGCDFEGHCDVDDFSKRIIEIFRPESSKREDTITCSLPGVTRDELEYKFGCKIRSDFICDGDAVL